MPAKRTSPKKTAPASADAVATPDAEPTAAPGEVAPGEAAAGEAANGDDAFVPANRAERRAQGKGRSATQPSGRGGAKVTGGHGPAHGQRMWSNRRSGG